MGTWNEALLDLDDELNQEIWARSPAVQAQLDEPRMGAHGSAAAAQALVGDVALPWVPDLVGSRWREPGALIIFGSSYADFFSPLAQRGRVMSMEEYLAPSAAAFQRRFVSRVMNGDAAYYGKVAELLLTAGVSLSRVVLTDLCRASFVKIEWNRADASEGVLRSHAGHFARYVQANRPWHLRRIDASGAQVIVALGNLATWGVLDLLVGSGWRGNGNARQQGHHDSARWVRQAARPPGQSTLTHSSGRRLVVLHVPHPSAHGSARPADGAPALRRLLGEDPPPAQPEEAGKPRAQPPRRKARPTALDNDAIWREAFKEAKPLAAADLLAEHPDAAGLTRELVASPSARLVVAVANAMFNPCRPARIDATGAEAVRIAWATLLSRRDVPFDRAGTKWERLLDALDPMPSWAKDRVRRMDIRGLGSLSQALIRGPYRQV